MAETAAGQRGDASTSEQPAHSGRLLLRMPRTLHAQLAETAERQGVSLNQLIVGTLARSVNGSGPNDDSGETHNGVAPERGPRLLTLALLVNLVVIVLAGGIAVTLLVAAWRGGF
jgi:hypothetical protein